MKQLIALSTLLAFVAPAAAEAQQAPPAPATITVSGDATVERSPDQATLSVTIVTSDNNATVSAGKNTTIYDTLKAKAEALGVSGDALRTSYYNVTFVPGPPKNAPPEQLLPPRTGYVTTRSLALTIAPIDSVGKLIDAANASGVTEVGNVGYELKDRHGAYLAALAAAMSDARQTAEAVAAAGNFKLGGYDRISVGAQSQPVTAAPMMMMRASAEAAPPPTDLGPAGPVQIRAHVTVSYLIR
jgi:uncharacterized protein YggE